MHVWFSVVSLNESLLLHHRNSAFLTPPPLAASLLLSSNLLACSSHWEKHPRLLRLPPSPWLDSSWLIGNLLTLKPVRKEIGSARSDHWRQFFFPLWNTEEVLGVRVGRWGQIYGPGEKVTERWSMSDSISTIITVLLPCFIAFASQTGPAEASQHQPSSE